MVHGALAVGCGKEWIFPQGEPPSSTHRVVAESGGGRNLAFTGKVLGSAKGYRVGRSLRC